MTGLTFAARAKAAPSELVRFDRRAKFAIDIDEDAQTAKVSGMAIVTNEPSYDGTLTIAPTALSDETDLSDVMLLAEHCGLAHARNTAETLTASIVDNGLAFSALLNLKRPDSLSLALAVADGAMYGCSWGALYGDLDFEQQDGVETMTAIRCVYEITICGMPVFPGTSVSIDGAAPEADEQPESVTASIPDGVAIALRRTKLNALRASIIGGQPRGTHN